MDTLTLVAMLSAPLTDGAGVSSLFSAGTVLGVVFGYLVGYIHAVWRRARADYKTVKASVPSLRTAKWAAWRSMVQRGTVAAAILTGVVVWLFTSASQGGVAP
jgi:hypothetical protein